MPFRQLWTIMQRLETRLCLAAAAALAAGAIFYVYARGSTAAAPLPALWTGSLPTLLHTAAFALLSLAVVAPWPRLATAVCSAWFVIESAFEILQIPAVGRLAGLSALEPGSSLLRAYLHGTFDPMDILAAGAGALLAGGIAAACARAPDVERSAR
jgi:hypothetical protein